MITDRHLAAADPAVADHLVAGVPVLPAAAQIDVVLTACAATRPDDRWWLDRVTFLAPLRVTAAGAEIRTEVADDGTRTVSSREPGGVFQCLGMLDGGAAGGCLPWFVGRVAARRPISGTVLARVELTPTDGAVGGSGATGNGVVRGRATVCSLQGEVLLEVERITLKAPARASSSGAVDRALPPVPAQPVPASSVPISAASSVTAPGWRPTTPAGPPDGEDDGARTTLVVSDEIDGATRTASVHDGTLAAALEHDRPDRVVYVPGPDDGTAGSATAAVQTAFALVRCLAANPPMVDLTVVTRGAHLVGAHPVGGGRVQPSHTALWGLARSLRVENPRTTIRLVDLGPNAAAAAALDTRAHPDPELARRDDTWFTPDLPAPTGIVELCERYDAPLMVDEAHSLGVLGATGRGITEHFGIDPARVAVKMGTLSKAVPSAGGYVAGSADLVFALKNNARGWMFSAAATPAQVAAAKAAVDVITAAPGMVVELRRRTERYRGLLHGLGFDNLASETPVVPVICRSAAQAQAMKASERTARPAAPRVGTVGPGYGLGVRTMASAQRTPTR